MARGGGGGGGEEPTRRSRNRRARDAPRGSFDDWSQRWSTSRWPPGQGRWPRIRNGVATMPRSRLTPAQADRRATRTDAGSDLGLLAPTARAAKKVLGVERIEPLPTGATQGETSRACEDAASRPRRPAAARLSGTRRFLSQGGVPLNPTTTPIAAPADSNYPLYRCVKGGHTTVSCNRDACRGCELEPQCTADTYRQVGRWTEEALLERMEARLAARPEILKQRREIAEHPFGSIKQWMNQGAFLLRGLEKVRAEFSLTALAYNFIRAVNIVGVASLLKWCEGGWSAPAGHLTPSRRWRLSCGARKWRPLFEI